MNIIRLNKTTPVSECGGQEINLAEVELQRED